MSNDVDRERRRKWEIAAFVAIAVLMLWDLGVDYAEGTSWAHIAVELVILLIAISGALLIWRRLKMTQQWLSAARAEARQWREENRELMDGLSSAIARQFQRWELTEAETEIGFLILKGLSHKEIARLRNTSERTVREQSRAVYRKSGLQGRAAFSAFFLEDIMLPGEPPG